jgi:Spy/CpxP family protein refolding chaperone
MGGRLTQLLLALSLLLNAFVLAGFIYRSWIAPPFGHQAPPQSSAWARGGPLEMMAADIGLNEDQRKALRGVFEKNQEARRQRLHDIQEIRERTGGELRKDPVDWTKIDGLVDQVTKLRGDSQKESLRAILDLEPQLTPQQREKLHSVLADRFINPPRWQRGGERGPARPSQ